MRSTDAGLTTTYPETLRSNCSSIPISSHYLLVAHTRVLMESELLTIFNWRVFSTMLAVSPHHSTTVVSNGTSHLDGLPPIGSSFKAFALPDKARLQEYWLRNGSERITPFGLIPARCSRSTMSLPNAETALDLVASMKFKRDSHGQTPLFWIFSAPSPPNSNSTTKRQLTPPVNAAELFLRLFKTPSTCHHKIRLLAT